MEYIGAKAFETELYKDCILNLASNSIFSTCKTEEDIRKKFENETNKLLQTIGAIPSNEYITFLSEVGTSNGRRIDSKYKNIIIEYKKYKRLSSDKDHKDAIEQLSDYLNDDQFIGKSVYGILFDGNTMEIYHKDEHGVFAIPNKKINGVISFKNLDFYFKTAFLSNKKEISSYCLREDFQIESSMVRDVYRTLFSKLKNRKNPRTTLMLKEWEKMFKLSESDSSDGIATHPDIIERRNVLAQLTGEIINNSEDEYNAIFTLHTLFSIILKLILVKSVNEFTSLFEEESFECLCNLKNNDLKTFFEELEHGNLLKKAGLINMIEGDFFSWYTKEKDIWNDNFLYKLKRIIATVAEYEDVRLKNYSYMQDLFRELYEAFIPRIIRHCFGEYYTPYWLAENVYIDSSFDKKTWCSVLDPCCGSGTFLICAINHRISSLYDGSDCELKCQFEKLTEGICGIDLNPLAVLMARINMFVNIAPHITDYYEIEMPIYNGDSTYSPTIEYLDNTKMLAYSLNTTIMGDKTFDITLPYEFIKSPKFISVIDKLEEYILMKNRSKAETYIIKELIKIDDTISKVVIDVVKKQVAKLIDLEEQELNGIWLRIFSNYLKTGILGKFDCIIGNPPWVRWNVLPENYRLTVKEKCKLDGLFSNDNNYGGVDLNICALIANKCCEKWLKETGRLSFLMPTNLLYNKSFEGFRNLYIDSEVGQKKLYFESIRNWAKSGDPFGDVKELFSTFNITFKKQDYLQGIPEYFVIKKNKKKLRNNSSWYDVQDCFDVKNKFLCVFTTENNNNFTSLDNENDKNDILTIIGKNNYNFRKGVDAQAPMRLSFKKTINETESEFYLWSKKNKRLCRTNQTIILENKYIRPFVSAPMIEKNEINWNNEYVICAYEDSNKPVDMDVLKRTAPKTARYLSSIELQLSNRSSFNKRIQNNKEFYALLRMGEYSFFDNYVVIRDNSKFVSCVVTKIKTHWGTDAIPIFDGHVSYISEHKKGTADSISLEEAKYINSILNLNVCELYIKNSVSLRSIGTRFNINIPLYDDNDPKIIKYMKTIKYGQIVDYTNYKPYFELIK